MIAYALIDCHAHANCWQKRHPGEKAALALGLLLLSLVLPWPGALAALAAATAATLAGARVPCRIWLKVMTIALLFLLPSAVTLVIGVESAPGGLRIVFCRERLTATCVVALRAVSATSCLNLLALTTPAYELAPLLRRWGAPAVIPDMMLVIHRMFFLLIERMNMMRIAQAARLGHAGRRNAMRSYGLLASALLLRVMNRAARMEMCLTARGYTGEMRALPLTRGYSRRFVVFTFLTWMVVLLAGILGMGSCHV